jgi:hypothetical protein
LKLDSKRRSKVSDFKGYLKTANPKAIAETSVRVIMAKLKAGKYVNEDYENADRKMLEHYLNGGT